jgi:hypothetical protein
VGVQQDHDFKHERIIKERARINYDLIEGKLIFRK